MQRIDQLLGELNVRNKSVSHLLVIEESDVRSLVDNDCWSAHNPKRVGPGPISLRCIDLIRAIDSPMCTIYKLTGI